MLLTVNQNFRNNKYFAFIWSLDFKLIQVFLVCELKTANSATQSFTP
jgi:hypothetical protein